MVFLDKILSYTEQRAIQYGTQYLTFAIFGIINYPLALIYEFYVNHDHNGLTLRIIALSLCICLLFKNHWPQKLKRFLPVFWYFTITISLPMMTTFMLLKNNLSLGWLLNFNIGVMIVILLLDYFTFLIVEAIGISLGVLLFYISGNHLSYQLNFEHLSLFIYMFICIIIFGSIFTRNKEIFNHFTQKAKDDANKILEQKVQERTIALEEALAAKTEFLNNISHEIRTPIQGFTAISDGLVEHWQVFDEEKRLSLAKTIAQNAKRLACLMTNLLDLAKLTANRMLLSYQELNLVLIVEDIINECTDLYIQDKNIKIIFIKPHKAYFKGDGERISQVMRNIFFNAIKFSPNNSIITANLNLLEDKWHLSLTDQGPGIPEAEIKNIFEPFFQSTRTKTGAGGTGLGLSICRQIIEAHNGRIWAKNNLDKGASFHFTIPAACINENLIIKSKLKILIIDDEESCITSMELLLLDTNYTLLKSSNGAKGIELLISNPDIDIILLDLMMPGMGGIDTLIEIKKNPQLAHIPIILQSGASEQAEIDKAYELGIVSFIKKPYDKQTVLKYIADAYVMPFPELK